MESSLFIVHLDMQIFLGFCTSDLLMYKKCTLFCNMCSAFAGYAESNCSGLPKDFVLKPDPITPYKNHAIFTDHVGNFNSQL